MGNFPYEKNFISECEINVVDSIKIIPTVFIRNEIFQYNTEKSLDLLADNITFLIAKRSMKNESIPVFKYDEIQLAYKNAKTAKFKALCTRMIGFSESDTKNKFEKLEKQFPQYYNNLYGCYNLEEFSNARR